MSRFSRDVTRVSPLQLLCFSGFLVISTLCLDIPAGAQTNSFPLYSSGAYSGAWNPDGTTYTNVQEKLQSTSGYIRAVAISADPNISIVYNYETGKNIYWGESTDAGNYWFRGRNLIVSDGKVAIGTSNLSGYNLAVNGSAIFTSARVKAYSYWPDFVFGQTYYLPSLDSVSRYIQINHHLPDVPSADSIQRAGIDLGTTDAVLLKKIEELTLYVIEQKKQLEKQQAAIARLEKLIRSKTKN